MHEKQLSNCEICGGAHSKEEHRDDIQTDAELQPKKQEYLAYIRHCVDTNIIPSIQEHKRYEEYLNDPDVIQLVQTVVAEKLETTDFVSIKNLIEVFNIEKSILEKLFLNWFKTWKNIFSPFNKRKIYDEIKDLKIISPEFLASSEFKQIALEKVAQILETQDQSVNVDGNVEDIMRVFDLSKEIFAHPRIKQAIRLGMIHKIEKLYWGFGDQISHLKSFAEKYDYPDVFSNPEVQEKAKKCIPVLAKQEHIDEYLNLFNFNETDTLTLAQELLQKSTKDEKINFGNKYGDPKEADLPTYPSNIEVIEHLVKRYQFDEDFIQKELGSYVERLIVKFLTDEKEINWSHYIDGNAYKYYKLLELFKENEFLQPYFKLPECEKQIKDFVLRNMVEYYKSDKPTPHTGRAHNVLVGFGLSKPTLEEIAVLSGQNKQDILEKIKSRITKKVDYSLSVFFKNDYQNIQFETDEINSIIEVDLAIDLGSDWEWQQWPADWINNIFNHYRTLFDNYSISPPTELIRKYTDILIKDINNYQYSEEEINNFIETVGEFIGLSPELSEKIGCEKIQFELNRFDQDWGETDYHEHGEDSFYPMHDEAIENETNRIRDRIMSLAKDFNIEEITLKNLIKQNYEKLKLRSERSAQIFLDCFGDINSLLESTTPEEKNEFILKNIVSSLKKHNLIWALKLACDLPDKKITDSPEIKTAMLEVLAENATDWFEESDEMILIQAIHLFLPELTANELLNLNQNATTNFTKIQQEFLGLLDRYLESVETIINFYPSLKHGEKIYDTLQSYPFLAEAVNDNEQYGLKLLFQFAKFDKLSKSNIKLLMELKQEITQSSDTNPNSRNFRIAIQEKLRSYRNNQTILDTLQKHEVDVDVWLNYEEEQYVELGESEKEASVQIETAITRIGESVELFLSHHKEVVKEWEKDLKEYKIPAQDPLQLQMELDKMRTKLESAKENEVEGIKKGIKNIESRLEKPKLTSVWSRFNGDLDRLKILKKDIFDSFEDLKNKEKALTELITSSTSTREKRKDLQKAKDGIKKLKVDLIEKTTKLKERVSSMQSKLTDLFTGPLGQERAQALAQEIAEQISEPIDHTNSDIETIKHTLTEEVNLQGISLSIALWDRNPAVDLYLGNYTDCCVRIDSEHLGSECTIADYLSDLGMQIITIVDDKTKRPVVAAWCWVGIDNDDNLAFVIDNIEANTDYSTKYRETLESNLKKFIETYARATGITRVVQGPSNNDLFVGKKMNSAYYKLGGYNRPSGYYLEGEDTSGYDNDDDDEEGEENDDNEGHDDEQILVR
ncbi:MAG: hypothetical protein UT32_C0024G0012 [Parcubacteria group bacterium GW2011_GWC2_39_14]|nr:MAG: hypothetical protein UT32_C0024G0012 [Parcubacteria group bacterium GW2011_GWC2_39_14]